MSGYGNVGCVNSSKLVKIYAGSTFNPTEASLLFLALWPPTDAL